MLRSVTEGARANLSIQMLLLLKATLNTLQSMNIINSLSGRIQAVSHTTLQLDAIATVKIAYRRNSLHITLHTKP
jgi:hypothetical protein